MKKFKLLVAFGFAAFIVLGIVASANATIYIYPNTELQWNENDYSSITNPLCPVIPGIVQFDGWETANWSQDPAPEGNLLYYATPGGDASSWLIEDDISLGTHAYLVVKDGQATHPYWYIFDLLNIEGSAWDGIEDIQLSGFWEGVPGSISHVSICGDSVPVPEPATMLLLGTGLLGLAGVSRRKFKKS